MSTNALTYSVDVSSFWKGYLVGSLFSIIFWIIIIYLAYVL